MRRWVDPLPDQAGHLLFARQQQRAGAQDQPVPGQLDSVWRRGATIRRSTGPWTPVDIIRRGVQAVCDLIVGQASKGDPFFQRHLAEGHLDGYQRDLGFIQSLRAPLQEALDAGR